MAAVEGDPRETLRKSRFVGFRPGLRKPVENEEKRGETVLTSRSEFAILDGLWKCLSAGQGGLSLFDNRYDVPESVRNHPSFRARMD